MKAVHILADGNPEPEVATFNFSPAMGACYATTCMRLSKTQKVYVVAAFSDGSYVEVPRRPLKSPLAGVVDKERNDGESKTSRKSPKDR